MTRDYNREIAAALAANDVATLGALAIELAGKVSRDDERRARQAQKKRRQRGTAMSGGDDPHPSPAVPGHEGTDGDTVGPVGTVGAPLPPHTPPTPACLPASGPTHTHTREGGDAEPPRRPAPRPAEPALAGTAIGDPARSAIAFCAAINRGIRDTHGESCTPLRYPAQLEATERILAAGVPTGWAADWLYRRAAASSADNVPRSLRYLADAVIQAWRDEQLRADAAAFTPSGEAAEAFDAPRSAAAAGAAGERPRRRRSAADETDAMLAELARLEAETLAQAETARAAAAAAPTLAREVA